jgi:hypothetical protein
VLDLKFAGSLDRAQSELQIRIGAASCPRAGPKSGLPGRHDNLAVVSTN